MGLRVPDWDGMVVLEGESYEKLFAVRPLLLRYWPGN